jgi:outer membrane protein assembly factor BamB
MRQTVFRAGLALALALAVAARAENWPQWRGPFFNGSTTETGLPSQWSKTNNVAWAAALPGFSGATPVIWEDSVFVSSPDPQRNLLLICLERKTGQARWQKVVAAGDREKGRNNMASPSPVTDGQSVFVLFGTGDLAAFDFSGKEVWRRQLASEYGRFAINWLYGSSPMLCGGRLYVEVIQSTPPDGVSQARDDTACPDSFLLCLDPATGRNLWRHVRPTDAVSEAQEAYTTPIPWEGTSGAEILVVGGNYVTAHSPATGQEIWRCGGLNAGGQRFWRVVPSPVVADGMIIACGPKHDPVLGIRDGGKGLVTDTELAWQFKEFPSDCVTPLFYRNNLYVLDGDRQMMTCLDPKTGRKKWQGNLGLREIFRASPTGADGRIYCLGENGTAVVLEAGEEFKILSTIPMGEAPVRSSIAAARGQLFIRTAQHLYCVGKPPS